MQFQGVSPQKRKWQRRKLNGKNNGSRLSMLGEEPLKNKMQKLVKKQKKLRAKLKRKGKNGSPSKSQ